MGIFKTEKQLDAYLETGMRGLMAKYDMPESELATGMDFVHTLMAEYSRLLQEGKIKRPYTYSAKQPVKTDDDIKFLAEQVFGGSRA